MCHAMRKDEADGKGGDGRAGADDKKMERQIELQSILSIDG